MFLLTISNFHLIKWLVPRLHCTELFSSWPHYSFSSYSKPFRTSSFENLPGNLSISFTNFFSMSRLLIVVVIFASVLGPLFFSVFAHPQVISSILSTLSFQCWWILNYIISFHLSSELLLHIFYWLLNIFTWVAVRHFKFIIAKQTFFSMLSKEIAKFLISTNQRYDKNSNGLHCWESMRGCYVMDSMWIHLHLWAVPKVFCSLPYGRWVIFKTELKTENPFFLII